MAEERPAASILVVDDNPAGRYATSRVLKAAGFAVIEASTGREALSLARNVDLVVLDVNLPDISGFEVCRRIRSTHEISHIPVIHLSATFVKDTDKVAGLEAGADGYLTHPVEPPVLIATINAFLRTRRAEDEMRKSEAKFKAIFDQALSGILLVSRDLVYLEANPAMCRMLGRTREEIIGRHGSAFVPTGYEHDTLAIARQVDENGNWRGTFPMIRADGEKIEVEWSISLHSVPGVRLAMATDVTQRKALEAEREQLLIAERTAREEAERANRLKDEFLAMLSHELRTPLNAIVGWSQILRSGSPSQQDLTEGIEAIERNARAQAQLISDLLDVSRITSGKLRMDAQRMDLAKVIREALEAVARSASEKRIHLEQALSSDAGPILGDPERIQQIIWNLVNNAIKFTPAGGNVRVALDREGDFARITVSDNGRGIKSEFLTYVFERFRQEDATARRNHGGLGLGLAIVKRIVELHGGTIEAKSGGEGQGATFVVRLPISSDSDGSHSTDAPAIPAASGTPVPSEKLTGARVLVVEDDPDARMLLKRLLGQAGATIAECNDAPSALERLPEFKPHILISDVGLPQRDGYELIREIRAQGLTARDLPAVALTAFARGEDRRDSLEAGFQVHLAKPVDSAELIAAIASLLK